MRKFSENTSVNYLGCVVRFEAWSGRSAAELGRAEVLGFLTHLVRERGVSASTQAGYLAALCFLYQVTLDRPEVVAGIPWPRQASRLPDVLSRSEIEAIFAATPLLKHRTAFLAGYSAGLRVSEVVHLQIDDIDGGYLRVTSPMLLGIRSPAEALCLPPPLPRVSPRRPRGSEPQAALVDAALRGGRTWRRGGVGIRGS